MSYTQLTLKERYHISACRKLGYKQKEIALELGVSPSTISRELRRNRNAQGHYDPESAQIETRLRHRFIYANKARGGRLYQALRHRNKSYHRRGAAKDSRARSPIVSRWWRRSLGSETGR